MDLLQSSLKLKFLFIFGIAAQWLVIYILVEILMLTYYARTRSPRLDHFFPTGTGEQGNNGNILSIEIGRNNMPSMEREPY